MIKKICGLLTPPSCDRILYRWPVSEHSYRDLSVLIRMLNNATDLSGSLTDKMTLMGIVVTE